MSSAVERLRENLVEVVSTLVTGVWMVGLFTGQDWWLGALLFGYVAAVPLAKILAGEHADETAADDVETTPDDAQATDSTDDALATLRERYAKGELTDAQFERKLERILEVETVEDASQYHESDRTWGGEPRGSADATGRNREAEPE